MIASVAVAANPQRISWRKDTLAAGEGLRVRSMGLPRPLTAPISLTSVGTDLIVGLPDSGLVMVVGQDGSQSSFRVPSNARKPSAAEIAGALDVAVSNVPLPLQPSAREALAEVPAVNALPPFFRILADPQGLLWLQKSPPGSPYLAFEILNRDGRIVGDVSLPRAGEVLEIGSDYILLSSDGVDGEPRVLVLRVWRREGRE
jgi:hypothetical protein